MIPRLLESACKSLFQQYPVLTITGSRQTGKTTLARAIFDLPYVNLEAPDQRNFATDDPRGFLGAYPDGVIIDEVQRVPELTSYIQVIVDERRGNSQFVLTGSQNFSIREALSQSLAGRTAILNLMPLSIPELNLTDLPQLDIDSRLRQGGFPRIVDQQLNPTQFHRDYVATYVERDLRQLSLIRDITRFQTFLGLCASNIGQILNLNRLANDCGISQTTATEWLTLLETSFILFRLKPFHANIRKRLVKRPKLYFYDVGLVAFLLGISDTSHVRSHPLRGLLFENLVVTEVLKHQLNRNLLPDLSFYRDSEGNEVDLVVGHGDACLPIEIKSGSTVSADYFKGLKRFNAVVDHYPYGRLVVYGGEEVQHRSDNTAVVPLADLDGVLNDRLETK